MSELKVQFGCGSNHLAGWENHDLGQDGVDVTKRLPYEDETVDLIFHEHLMEHLSGPDALRFLDECHRILKPNGAMRVCVPVLNSLNIVEARDIILNHGHLCAYTKESLIIFIQQARFYVTEDIRQEIDGHHLVIGRQKDNIETCRLNCTKIVE